MPLPKPPAEVPVRKDLELLAPRFRVKLTKVLVRMRERGFDPVVVETLRDDDRQRFLYGFGREYDDGRGVVTKAATADTTWHGFGLAADVISHSQRWDAPEEFWTALGEESRAEGLTWGADWDGDGIQADRDPDEKFADRPHVQFGPPMRRYPSPLAKQIRDEHGLEALWRTVGAVA